MIASSWPRGASRTRSNACVLGSGRSAKSTLSITGGTNSLHWLIQHTRDASHVLNLRENMVVSSVHLDQRSLYQTSSPRQDIRDFERNRPAPSPIRQVVDSARASYVRLRLGLLVSSRAHSSIDSEICFLSWLRRFQLDVKRPS
jgi:hypothetical protein